MSESTCSSECSTVTYSTGSSEKKKLKLKLSVLIVDDDLLLLSIHEHLLKKFDMKVDTVINGREAICAFKEGFSYDVVFMDNEMPIIDGITATRNLRAMGVKCMIVGLYGKFDENEVKAFQDAGLDECFQKPLTEEKVKTILKKLSG